MSSMRLTRISFQVICFHVVSSLFFPSHFHPSNKRSTGIRRHDVLFVASKIEVQSEENYGLTKPSSSTTKSSCSHCGQRFETRNLLFRHLRNDPVCSNEGKSDQSSTSNDVVLKRDTIAVLYSYDSFLLKDENHTSFITHESDAETVGKMICDAFNRALDQKFSSYNEDSKVIGCTQSSVAKLRVNSLGLENGVSASGDVMTLTYEYPIKRTFMEEKLTFQEDQREKLLQHLKQDAIRFISNNSTGDKISSSSIITDVHIISAKILPVEKKLHAESYCTQRIFHYLLPIKWIDGGDEIEEWWLKNQKYEPDSIKTSTTTNFGIQGEPRLVARPPDEMRSFKNILRSFEGQRKEADESNFNGSIKRFGNLANKPLRAWHNFADTTIRGAAVSPNNRPIWRALDRCRIVKLLSIPEDNNAMNGDIKDRDESCVVVVIEFRGDDFIQQQIRRIIGAAVAMSNDWLPPNFADTATRPDVFIETPLAPANRMYQTRPRFHFDELSNNGKSMFHDEVDESFEVTCTGKLHHRMLQRCQDQLADEKKWLSTLRQMTAPHICDQIKNYEDINQIDAADLKSPTPPQYLRTLTILQEISSSGKWPATSAARARVIKNKNYDSNSEKSDTSQNGSFTIINPKYVSGILMDKNVGIKAPLGNTLFPELVEAIFELEENLSKELMSTDTKGGKQTKIRRPSSSHCAVNCNAQFTPHVDSGRGCGQSMSMIVGLGSYSGGAIYIEETPFNIHYKPLEFDGWRDRHWTEPFVGERYSLVWFTPEMKGINKT